MPKMRNENTGYKEMNYYEVVIVNDEDKKERYLVKSSSTSKAERKISKQFPMNEIVSVKLTKFIDVI